MQYQSCLEAFPECPNTGAVTYFPPCKLQCQMLNAQCGASFDCDPYPSVGCTLLVQSGYFVMDPGQVRFLLCCDHYYRRVLHHVLTNLRTVCVCAMCGVRGAGSV
jgi:hypothetical protein